LTTYDGDVQALRALKAGAPCRSLRSILEIREALGCGLGQDRIAEYAARGRLHSSPAPANK
jgi:hypothetical protein